MIEKRFSVFALVLVLVLIKAVLSDEDHVYTLGFTDVAEDCQGFSNDVVIAKMELKAKGDHAALSGSIEFKKELGDTCELFVDLMKKMDDGGEDPVFNTGMNLCVSIKDKDAPWGDVYKNMGISNCPISAKIYTVDDMMISLDFAKDFLNHQFVNKYNTKLTIKCGLDDVSCITVGVEIIED